MAEGSLDYLREQLEELERAGTALHPPVPPPAPAISRDTAAAVSSATADQSWRKTIDWAAAGRKAYETRMRNAALRAGTPATPAIASKPAPPVPPKASPVARLGKREPAPKEEHTRRARSSR